MKKYFKHNNRRKFRPVNEGKYLPSGGRKLVYDIELFFGWDQCLPNGSYTTIAYVSTPKSYMSLKQRRVADLLKHDRELNQIISMYPEYRITRKLIEYRDSEGYANVLNGSKKSSAVAGLTDENFIRFSAYTFNWKNRYYMGKNEEGRVTKEQELRAKYGFGKDASEYKDGDWRLKNEYGGATRLRQPIKDNKGNNSKLHDILAQMENPYISDEEFDRLEVEYKQICADMNTRANARIGNDYIGDEDGIFRPEKVKYTNDEWGLYTKPDYGYNKHYRILGDGNKMLNQNLVANKEGKYQEKSVTFFIDDDGYMEEVPTEILKWLTNGNKATKGIEDDLDKEEMEFKAELEKLDIQNSHDHKEFYMNRILYIVGTVIDKTGKRQPLLYVHPDITEQIPNCDRTVAINIINEWANKAIRSLDKHEQELLKENLNTRRLITRKLIENYRR